MKTAKNITSLLFIAICIAVVALWIAAELAMAQPVPKPEQAKKTEVSGSMKPETKELLLVYQAQLTSINQAIDASELGKRRAAITEKFQAVLATGRTECGGGEPTFGSGKDDGKLICQPPAKETAKVEPKLKE